MLARIKTAAIHGIDAASVEAEVRVTDGQGSFTIIGLGDSAVRESRDRVLSALRQSGFKLPKVILVNLAPAEMRKEGSAFDLPIALGVLAASGQLKPQRLAGMSFHGELALDGKIKPVRGALSLALEAVRRGMKEVIVPLANCPEVMLLGKGGITGAGHLMEVVRYVNSGLRPQQPTCAPADTCPAIASSGSLTEVVGQQLAKRALAIAAAGGHNLLMIGPPGCGKSMLAARFPVILPPLTEEERLETVRIHSIAGNDFRSLLSGLRPFRAPHHSVSDAGLVGGGTSPKPGEISLAHNGILFLDEFPEFRRSALEALRAPLEIGTVQITRAKGSVIYPARFQLIAAMNPCPCGRLGAQRKDLNSVCMCSRSAIEAYLRKLSQPILDRIDLHVELDAVPIAVLARQAGVASTANDDDLRAAVCRARDAQLQRANKLNRDLSLSELMARLGPASRDVLGLLESAAKRLNLSARGYVRSLRVASTIADLAGNPSVTVEHVAEALSFRSLERLENYLKR